MNVPLKMYCRNICGADGLNHRCCKIYGPQIWSPRSTGIFYVYFINSPSPYKWSSGHWISDNGGPVVYWKLYWYVCCVLKGSWTSSS